MIARPANWLDERVIVIPRPETLTRFETSHKRREGIVTSPAGLLFRDFRRSHRMTEISNSGYRFPPEIIQQAIWLWWLFAYFVVITIGKLYLSPITKPSRRSHDRALSRHFRLVVPLAVR